MRIFRVAPRVKPEPVRWIRWLMIAAGTLALGGLSGVVFGDMQLRNISILGYVGVFLVVAVLFSVLFHRAAVPEGPPSQPSSSDRASAG